MKRWFFAVTLILSILFIKAGWGIDGIFAKIIVIMGVIGIFKAIFFLKGKASDKMLEWFLAWPSKYLRMWAGAQIIFGVVILLVNR